MDQVCFDTSSFRLYMYVLVIILIFIGYIFYIKFTKSERMTNFDTTNGLTIDQLKHKLSEISALLHESNIAEQTCKQQLAFISNKSVRTEQQQLNKLYNPLTPPERTYTSSRSSTNGYDNYQVIGYLYSGNTRLPLFGRYKYPGRSEKWEYFVSDESRNYIKIPFKTINDNEIYDGDDVTVDTLGQFKAKIYEYDNFRYNPNL